MTGYADKWWLEYAVPLYEALDATNALPDTATIEDRLALLREKCLWLKETAPIPANINDLDPASWTPVTSTNIASYRQVYAREGDAPSKLCLDIAFKSGTVWRYSDVPVETIAEFIEAESKGGFFASRIKGTFFGEKLENVRV